MTTEETTVLETIPMPPHEDPAAGTDVLVRTAAEVASWGGGKLYELIDEFDADLIVAGVDDSIVEKWCYAFRQGRDMVVGMSVHGVVNAVREMGRHGEIIRCGDPNILFENDEEIRLSCTAVRYLIDPQTRQMIELDRATRGLRQTKFQMIDEWEGPQGARKRTGNKVRSDDPKWWEKAFSKAQRNAQFPLIREDCKTVILNAYKQTPKYAELSAPSDRAPASRQVSVPRRQQQVSAPRAAAPDAAPAMSTAYQQARIVSMLTDLRQSTSGDPQFYLATYKKIGEKWPHAFGPDKRLNQLAKLTNADATKLLAFIQEASGGPPPEQAPPETAELEPDPAGPDIEPDDEGDDSPYGE